MRAGSITRATYSTTVIGNVIAIRDSGSGKSVTNDAENVVSDFVKAGFNLGHYRIIYCDTRGVWDEMVIRDARFASFASINERDLTVALKKVGAAAVPTTPLPYYRLLIKRNRCWFTAAVDHSELPLQTYVHSCFPSLPANASRIERQLTNGEWEPVELFQKAADGNWTGPVDSDMQPCRFRNHYHCEKCETGWTDDWSCICNDRCPSCNAEIEPYDTTELDHEE